jgi:hypothetical protein
MQAASVDGFDPKERPDQMPTCPSCRQAYRIESFDECMADIEENEHNGGEVDDMSDLDESIGEREEHQDRIIHYSNNLHVVVADTGTSRGDMALDVAAMEEWMATMAEDMERMNRDMF